MLPEIAAAHVARSPFSVSGEIVDSARAALCRVAEDSELREVWREDAGEEEWLQTVHEIMEQLQRSS